MQPPIFAPKEKQLKNHVKIGSIEIRVISQPRIKVEKLEGILKSKEEKRKGEKGKSSTEIVRSLRKEDYEREEKRLGSD